ncbi:MAG: hypothetical protein AAGC70_20475 [Pseudomonadota bacterium]
MRSSRIHVTGASGSGVTTLGRFVAHALAIPHHDTDDYFWQPTHPPFRTKRPAEDRIRLMEDVFLPRTQWVLTGSLDGWGDVIAHRYFDLVVYVSTPTDIRLQRLREREARRFGDDAFGVGGWREEDLANFLAWAAQYDNPGDGFTGRSRSRHDAWLKTLPCPVLGVPGTDCIDDLTARVVAEVLKLSGNRPRHS